jgi:hypothetical protein
MRRKGFKYYRLNQIAVFLLCLIFAANVQAFSLLIGESQIQSMLALTFPYQTRVGNSFIRLTEPKPHFYEASQEIGIALKLFLKDQTSGQTTQGSVLVLGGVHFDSQQQLLQLVRPKIASLDWVNPSTGVEQELVKQATQLVGQALPIIILFDIKQMTGDALAPTLSDIRVKKQGIEVIF